VSGYQDQLRALIEERALHERAIGDINARIDQALLLIAVLDEAAPARKPKLVVTGESAPLQDAVYEIVGAAPAKGLEFYDIMESVRYQRIEANTATVRATLAKLIDKRRIRRLARGVYAPLVVEAIA
jgi:hypothetical protein